MRVFSKFGSCFEKFGFMCSINENKKAALKPLKIYVYRKEKTLYRTLKVQIGGLIHMEVPPGFEPGNNGFADRGLTTWLWYRMERMTRLELATSTLARWRSTR